jgi:predicted metal-binding protein
MELFGWVKGKSAEGRTRFTEEEAPVSNAMVWLCEKCGAKLSRDEATNPARSIQKAFKELVSEKKEKREIRAMVTTCMNVCPKEKMAAGIVDVKSGKTRFISFEVKGSVADLAEDIYKQIR